ncbi:hypothetical protein CO2235_MP100009 [Cupriavidus oxalaticus]|uniref:Uncharacterized protein n=1 Tax=Cupriavidus oxalaticus TaxID=96344 RepID=A0A976GC29_9BURK|nr:hypothetical protein CO2235_MP100009 [Cupriavidus oxalaticus]
MVVTERAATETPRRCAADGTRLHRSGASHVFRTPRPARGATTGPGILLQCQRRPPVAAMTKT